MSKTNLLSMFIVALVIFAVYSSTQGADPLPQQPATPKPMENVATAQPTPSANSINPFELKKDRVVPGTLFQIEVVDQTVFNINNDTVKLKLKFIDGEGEEKEEIISNYYFRKEKDKLFIEGMMPESKKLLKMVNGLLVEIFKSYEANLEIVHVRSADRREIPFSLQVKLPSVKSAYLLGIAVLLLSFVIIAVLKPDPFQQQDGFSKDTDKSLEEWRQRKHLAKRFFLFPLNFAITPLGNYSVSLAQNLIWTFVTIFALVFVYRLTGSFLEITPQILMFLGISGATAIGYKINANARSYDIPSKYLNLVVKKRVPSLKDLISTSGRPNIFKFQILFFTLLTAYIVLIEITRKYTFPTIPENLVTLMSISSAVYLGNEVTQENVWEKIKNKIDEIEQYAKGNSKSFLTTPDIENLRIPQVDELKKMLEGIFA